ncbi:hypothetical protein LXA43DRAFT_1101711 [Ganoderma leucocontextum]|nr:hypothetical protein LXA43DRAFT_1101711 [Ganoderma leucocontextum]
MPKVSKKLRIHNKRSPGSTRGNTEANIKGKRKHTSGASVNTSLHKPKGLISISVDVFLEGLKIAAQLDLLHLSRVSTDFRAVLLAKQNKSVWVVARNSLDPPMPSCPDDLSEPKYASLAFDQFCMICGAVPPKYKLDVSCASCIRLCKQCWKTNIKVGYTIIRELRVEPQIRRDRSLKRVILDLLPETSGCRGYATPDVVQQTPLHNLNFYQPDVAAAVKEYYTVVESSGGDSRILEEYVECRKARTFFLSFFLDPVYCPARPCLMVGIRYMV